MTPPRFHTSELVGIGFALIAATAYGTWTVLTKVAFRNGVGVPLLVVSRFAVGAVSLWLIARLMGLSARPRSTQALALVALGVSFLVFSVLISLSIERIPAATASLLLYTHPAMVAGIGIAFTGERLTTIGAVGLGLSLGGTALILGLPQDATDGLGVALGLGAALFLAINVVAIDRLTPGLHPFVSSAYIMTGGAISSALYAVPSGLDLSVSATGWTIVLVLALLSTIIAFTAKVISIERLGPTRASIANTFEPVVSVLLAAVVLAERLGPAQLAGGLLVVLAVAILPLTRRQRVAETHALYGAATALEPDREPADPSGAISPPSRGTTR